MKLDMFHHCNNFKTSTQLNILKSLWGLEHVHTTKGYNNYIQHDKCKI